MSTPTPIAATGIPGLEVLGPIRTGYERILSPEALDFVADLTRRFRPRLGELMNARAERQALLDSGATLDFMAETAAVREGAWTVAPLPPDLLRRTVEITGPVERKMVINALNSGANCFMADFEDSNAPTWDNNVQGQNNLYDAVRRTIEYADPTSGKQYRLNEVTATLLVRPRGLHLPERHVVIDGKPVPGCLFDFGLYFFHNARALLGRGTGPYFYLPKLQSHREARFWNDVFIRAQELLGIPSGTIKATVLIETLPAAFQMDEILYELREHSAGLNCGRWDYIFSFIKTRRHDSQAILPDRSQVTMEQPFMRAYTQLCVRTCHRRGVHAMGGMAAQIPIKNDPAANSRALEKVRADKLREVMDGHDGTWVAHPGLVSVAREVFEAVMPGPNQLERRREDVHASAADLLEVPRGTRTEEGLRLNVRVGIQYTEAWLRGNGCVPLYNLMEDAATAEISRSQVWQWVRHGATLEDGRTVDAGLLRAVTDDEMKRIESEIGAERLRRGRFHEARALFERISTQEKLEDFLTLPAYQLLDSADSTSTDGPQTTDNSRR
ncbi:MAG TPA: malate synthase A [Candidatus Dormibacteraeota bacterium]|nr:malate synthase A [Candidatus Dormibacteraeota bacterium]